MRADRKRLVIRAGLLLLSAVALHACAPRAPVPSDSALTPVGTLRDIMENIIEPTADVIFEAVSTDVNVGSIVEHRPTTDAEWEVIQHNALMLVEATNLIKMERPIAKPGDENTKSEEAAPELTPAQIKVKKDQSPALWIKYADGLRDASIKALNAANMKDADKLFLIGDGIDKACESCHLEDRVPAEKKAVIEDQQKRATPGPGTPKPN